MKLAINITLVCVRVQSINVVNNIYRVNVRLVKKCHSKSKRFFERCSKCKLRVQRHEENECNVKSLREGGAA